MTDTAWTNYVNACKVRKVKPTPRNVLERDEPLAENPVLTRLKGAHNEQRFIITKGWVCKLLDELGYDAASIIGNK